MVDRSLLRRTALRTVEPCYDTMVEMAPHILPCFTIFKLKLVLARRRELETKVDRQWLIASPAIIDRRSSWKDGVAVKRDRGSMRGCSEPGAQPSVHPGAARGCGTSAH